MPMLADIDDPPRSRLPGILLGLLIGLPVAGVCAWLILPPLIGAVVGSAADFDKRLRQEDQYMKALCDEAMVVARDEALCTCIWAVEFPSLDCHAPFLRWSLDRHRESCADPGTRRDALSFCTCVDVIAGRVDEAEAAEPGGGAARQEALRLEGCFRLDDALSLPPLESLAPAP